jgi:transposase
MDDIRCKQFFAQPTQPYHRQYEALRAIFLEGHSQKEVADRFGYTYDSLRQLVRDFRQQDDHASASAPFFAS